MQEIEETATKNGREISKYKRSKDGKKRDESSEEKKRSEERSQEKKKGESSEETTSDLRKEAFQLANYYFVFQGVILTTTYSPPTKYKCDYYWVPLTLSILAGVVNLCALLAIAFKYKKILDEEDNLISGNRNLSTFQYAKIWRWCYIVCCMLLFLAFFGVTIAGSIIIPCKGNYYTYAVAECVKQCVQA